MKPRHLLVVSQLFYPEQFRINDMCCEWVKRGYKVTVVTGIPNYPQGSFYDGYGWFKKRKETWNGVDIIRIPLIARCKNPVCLALNYFSFVASGFFWKSFTKIKADIVFTYEVSPMTQALVGVWYAKRRKVPHYLYVQDLWPENVEIVAGVKNKAVINAISKMVNYIYKNSDRIFATSPSFVKEIQKRTPNEENKVTYWPQYAEDFYVPQPKRKISDIPDDGKFKIVFTGNIGHAQGLEILPDTAKALKKKGITDISFVIVGDGRYKDTLLKTIHSYGVDDMFHMVERQPAERVPEILAACDVAFVSFLDNALFSKTIPAKLQSYMACGVPILASTTGETQRIIEEADCGVCCKLGDAEALVLAIDKIRKADRPKMSRNARTYFLKNFKKSDLMDKMDSYFGSELSTRQSIKLVSE